MYLLCLSKGVQPTAMYFLCLNKGVLSAVNVHCIFISLKECRQYIFLCLNKGVLSAVNVHWIFICLKECSRQAIYYLVLMVRSPVGKQCFYLQREVTAAASKFQGWKQYIFHFKLTLRFPKEKWLKRQRKRQHIALGRETAVPHYLGYQYK
jgi:hypothetical protein